jgi:soluble lytic murein transglycosylase-like protein
LITHAHQPLKPQVNHISTTWIPATVKKWEPTINQMSEKYSVDPNLIAIIMTIESGGDPKAVSSAGAKGLMQITGPTAKEIASKHLKEPVSQYNLFDPETNIEFGTAYLAYLRDTFGEWQQGPSWNYTAELVAAGYNGGPGAANSVYKGEGLTDTQTVVYSRDVFNMWRERNAKKSPTYDRWLERGGQALVDAAESENK